MVMKRRISHCAALLFFWIASSGVNFAADAIDIGSRRELFVDHFLIDKLNNTQLRLHEPHRDGIAFKFDKPWEGGFSCYATVIKDGDLYRMWYRGLPVAGNDGAGFDSTCYAESKDGINWAKPNLGLIEIQGTRDNNVILTNEPFAHNFSPFLDERPDVPVDEKYKAVAGYMKVGLHAFKSPDGIHWSQMQTGAVFTNGAFDSQNVSFWSATEKQYICYFRTYKKFNGKGCRWISRTTSKDFINWSERVDMEFGDTPPEELYTNGTHPYFRAPHISIALAKRWFPNKVAISAEQAKALVENPNYRSSSSDSIFMTTRGGNHYERTFLEAFIRPGPDPEDWIARDNTPALGVVPANDREMFIYRGAHYAQPSANMARYTLRTDGFVSVSAPYAGGEMLTKPLQFSGSRLEINFSSSAAGGLRVEVQDEQGVAIPGFASADCPEMMGDDISRIVSWEQGPDLGKLAGKTVRLRFLMKDADLYSLKFL